MKPKKIRGLQSVVEDAELRRAIKALRAAGNEREADRLELNLPVDDA